MDIARRKKRLGLHLSLFFITFATTTTAGAMQNGVNPLADPWGIGSGLPFAVTLMTILLVHEMGHYLMSRYHGVQASLPYFIPAPPPFIAGTFGAFIKMDFPPRDRRALFDVGAAGPLAGLVLAIPAVVVGLQLSTVAPGESSARGITLGSSLLLRFLSQMTLGIRPEEATVVLHPIAVAGWFGLFVTALNLLPVGQLDGGHVTYALFGPRHTWIARLTVGTVLTLGIFGQWYGWLIWGALLLFLGVQHPTPLDPHTPLDLKRRVLAWLTLVVLLITFVPVPLSLKEPKTELPSAESPVSPPKPSVNGAKR